MREVIFLEYSIGEFSRLTNVGIHTLRYYEHEKLIEPKRNSANRRRYSDEDLAWIAFIRRLKDTGMPIKKIQQYAQLRAKGSRTLAKRMKMLSAHRETLSGQIQTLQEHLARLDEKIGFYRREIQLMEK